MKYRKLFAKAFMKNSGNDAAVATALVAGLAVGAVLAVLFAPDSGKNVRRKIGEQSGGLASDLKDLYGTLRTRLVGEQQEEELAAETEVPHFKKQVQKKPKSDIKEILHEAHAEQSQESADSAESVESGENNGSAESQKS